jgi:hypothetical protein
MRTTAQRFGYYLFSLITILIYCFCSGEIGAFDIGLVSVQDTISLGPLICRDSLGKEAIPDSVHVLVWYGGGGANTVAYTARSSSPKSEAYIDTTALGGHQYFYFKNVIDSIDGNKPNGPYSGGVAFFKQGQTTVNQFSFTKVGNSAKNYFARIDTAISSRTGGTPANFSSLKINAGGYVCPNFEDINGEITPSLFSKSYFAVIADTVANRILLLPENKLLTDVNGDIFLGFGSITSEIIADAAITPTKFSTYAINLDVIDPAVSSSIADSTASHNVGINWANVANPSANLNLSNTRLRQVDSLVALTNNSITSTKLANDAIEAAKIKDGAFSNLKFANNVFDSLNFDSTYRAMLDLHAGGTSAWSGPQRDSVLKMARAYETDSLAVHLGKNGFSSSRVSLHMKLGAYSGASGDNNNLKDDIAALNLNGGGTEPETIIVRSLNDSSSIQGAKITIRTLDQMTTRVPGLGTDSYGRRLVELDPASYVLIVTANNYIQVIDTISVVGGGGTVGILMQEFDPGMPPAPNLCRVYGWVYDIGGDDLAGIEVTAEIPKKYHPVKYSGVVVTPYLKTTVTDSTGYWFMDIFPNLILSDGDSKYLFTIKYNSGVIYRVELAVPDTASWQLQ